MPQEGQGKKTKRSNMKNTRPRSRRNWTKQDYKDWGNEHFCNFITEFYCAICKKLKHKDQLKLVKPLTIHCNSCISKNKQTKKGETNAK